MTPEEKFARILELNRISNTRKLTPEEGKEHHYLAVSLSLTGRSLSSDHRESLKGCQKGEPKKGRSELSRRTTQHLELIDAALLRDSFTCQRCGSKIDLVVHHIKDWDNFPELRYKLDNLITWCRCCHQSIHTKERFRK